MSEKDLHAPSKPRLSYRSVEGPWTDRDKVVYVPRQCRGFENRFHPYQKKVIDSAKTFDARTVNYVYDQGGNAGKSTIASICCLLHKGIRVPPVNDSEKLLSVSTWARGGVAS